MKFPSKFLRRLITPIASPILRRLEQRFVRRVEYEMLEEQITQLVARIAHLEKVGTQETIVSSPEIPSQPHLPDAAMARFRELLAASQCYLEYGSGGSTMLAATMGVSKIYSVESDANWLAILRQEIDRVKSTGEIYLLHGNIGPTTDWGWPTGVPIGTQAADYALSVWDRLSRQNQNPDLVLIDGRYRIACFFASLLQVKSGAVLLFDDYLDRPYYAEAVEQILKPQIYHERMAEFLVPQTFNRDLVERLLTRYTPDPR